MAKEIKVFKALSDGNRLEILNCICSKDKKKINGSCCQSACVKDLAKHLKISIPTASHHIKELVNAGLVDTKKQGKWVYCCINKKAVSEIRNFLKKFSGIKRSKNFKKHKLP